MKGKMKPMKVTVKVLTILCICSVCVYQKELQVLGQGQVLQGNEGTTEVTAYVSPEEPQEDIDKETVEELQKKIESVSTGDTALLLLWGMLWTILGVGIWKYLKKKA